MLRTAWIMGWTAVALGAFGAHGLRAHLMVAGRMETWKTAVEYHLIHAVVLLLIAWVKPAAVWPFRLLLSGVVVFSGSLYVLCWTNAGWVGTITPVGGIILLAGWASLGFSSLTGESRLSGSNR